MRNAGKVKLLWLMLTGHLHFESCKIILIEAIFLKIFVKHVAKGIAPLAGGMATVHDGVGGKD